MFRFWVFQILNGLTTGALLFLVASGLSVVFGLMRILNLSHGALFLLGGFVGLSVQLMTGSFVLAALAGLLAAGVLGLIIQQVFSRTLLGTPFNQVLLTLGIAFVLNNSILAIWGGAPGRLDAPRLFKQSVSIFNVTYPSYRLFLIVFSLAAGALLWLIWERSRLGAVVRAFKSAATRRINRLLGTPGESVWQRGYWDRIIRNEREWHAIRKYILNNPATWHEDTLNPGK